LIHGTSKTAVRGVSIDSRSIRRGELFFAIAGDTFDGHRFVPDVIRKGACAVVVHKEIRPIPKGVAVIRVDDTQKALGRLAHFYRMRFNIPVIAITGSAGKTTTKEMIAAVLKDRYRVHVNQGTQNNHIGVPLTLLRIKPAHEVVVVECGTNQPGDIAWLAAMVRPTVAVFTNIGESHLEKLKSPKGVLKEKWDLTRFMDRKGVVIYNSIDPLLLKAAGKHPGRTIPYKGTNAQAAAACGRLLGVNRRHSKKILAGFGSLQGRGQVIDLKGRWVIDDTYNANPVSMRCAIEALMRFPTKGRRLLVVGDMLELGAQSKKLHQAVGTLIGKADVDVLISVGILARGIAQQAKKIDRHLSAFMYGDVDAAAKKLLELFRQKDVVLIKGSRAMKLERIIDQIKG